MHLRSFFTSALDPAMGAETAAALELTDPPVVASGFFKGEI
jgi:hypothetical protein